MRAKYAALATTVLLTTSCTKVGTGTIAETGPKPQTATKALKIEATTDLDKVGPGGFDVRVTRRFWKSKLHDCSGRVAEATTQWGNSNSLAATRKELGDGRVLIHLQVPSTLRGYFEVLYRLDENERGATVSFTLFDNAGTGVEPLGSYGPAKLLADELEKAILCDD